MKFIKILLFSIVTFITTSNNTLATSLEEKLNTIFEKKIDNKIENKYKEKDKICIVKKTVYSKLENKLKTIKKEKYQKLIKLIIKYIENRKQNIKECKIEVKTNNPILHFQVDKKLLEEEIKTQNNKILKDINTSFSLDKIAYAKQVYRNNFFEIKNKWYMIKKALYTNSSSVTKDLINRLQNENPWKNILILKNTTWYKIYLYDIDNVTYMWDVNPNKSVLENKKALLDIWIIYLNNFYYKKTNSDNILIAGLSKIWNNLVYFIASSDASYYLPKSSKDIIPLAISNKDVKNIVYYKWKYYIWTNNWKIAIYNLGNINLYKKINKKLLWKLLYSSFHKIVTYNLKYSYKDMYKIIKIAEYFDGKDLKSVYRFITTNFKYDTTISKKLKQNITNEQLEKDIYSTPSLYKLWNIFYIIEKKVAICQTLSELLSIIALFNWQEWDIVVGSIWYAHQISKINNFYYDPTNDLWKKDNFKYFGMTKEKLLKYFTIKN